MTNLLKSKATGNNMRQTYYHIQHDSIIIKGGKVIMSIKYSNQPEKSPGCGIPIDVYHSVNAFSFPSRCNTSVTASGLLSAIFFKSFNDSCRLCKKRCL